MKAILVVLTLAAAMPVAAAATSGAQVADTKVGGRNLGRRGSRPTAVLAVRVRRSRLSLAGIAQNRRVLGNPRAPVVLAVWEDPQCPVCREWHTKVLPALVRKYVRTDKLQIQWHGFAVIGPMSLTSEAFVFAAGLQNHLWDMIDDIMANQGEENSGWLNDRLVERIGDLIPGFKVAAELLDLHAHTVVSEINSDERHGTRMGLKGVPFIELGRRGGPIRPLEFSAYEPQEFERPINRLLRER